MHAGAAAESTASADDAGLPSTKVVLEVNVAVMMVTVVVDVVEVRWWWLMERCSRSLTEVKARLTGSRLMRMKEKSPWELVVGEFESKVYPLA